MKSFEVLKMEKNNPFILSINLIKEEESEKGKRKKKKRIRKKRMGKGNRKK